MITVNIYNLPVKISALKYFPRGARSKEYISIMRQNLPDPD